MLMEVGRELVRGARQLLYPAACTACGRPLPEGVDWFCCACHESLVADPHRTCPRCSSSVGEFAHVEKGCARCRGDTLHFAESFRLGPYDGPLRDVILRLKFGPDETLADALGRAWARHAESRLRAVGASS